MANTKKTSNIGLKKIDKRPKPKRKLSKPKRKSKLAPIASVSKIQVKQYIYEKEKMTNNPPIGLVTPDSDIDLPAKKYSFDPYLDPQLEWSGKAENSDFEVDTVSLHRHERIDPMTIIRKVLKKQGLEQQTLFPFFESLENTLPLRDVIEFYKHDLGWSNRLIAGDSLLVMNSLLEKEGMEEKVQMIYIDPPYGIKYGSNFQPFVNKLEVKDRNDDDLTSEPETLKAFRDTWELEIHSYLSFLRNRIALSKKLLSDSGSIFIQISEENLHRIRIILDEIFGAENFVSQISVKRVTMFAKKLLNNAVFYIVWYAKNISAIKYNPLFLERNYESFVSNAGSHTRIEDSKGKTRRLTNEEMNDISSFMNNHKDFRLCQLIALNANGTEKQKGFEFNGETFVPAKGQQWKTSYPDGLNQLKKENRLEKEGTTLRYKLYYDDYPVTTMNSLWDNIGPASDKVYVVQTPVTIIKRCMLLTTDPTDLVFDPTCGSGTTAFVAEQLGRRWITCDTSRVATAITRQRLMTATFDYYVLEHPDEGISSGFKYKTVPHVTLGSIANNEPPGEERLYDQPLIDKNTIRITGPFTIEAVPSPTVKSLDIEYGKISEIDSSISRIVESKRLQDWRDELLSAGVRGKNGQKIEFLRVESHPSSRWIHATGETKESKPKMIAVSFGPEHAPLEKNQVALAIAEAQKFVPKPNLIIFASLQFDPEAAKDIDELQWPGIQVLRVHVNADLLTSDLKKKRASNESFWLMGQPDVDLKKQKDGKYIVEVRGFDYYNTQSGEIEIESGDSSKIVMWMLDTDYDERSVYPQQVFFPMSGSSDGWSKLAKTLKSEIDEQLIEHYSGTKSLPFSAGPNKQVAIKIIDDRGIESLRIIKIE